MSGEHMLKAVRGSFIDVTRTVDNPEKIVSTLWFIKDGLLLIKQGKVGWFGEWEDRKHQIPDTIRVCDYRGKLIVPGSVNTYIRHPQSEMMGAYGEQLLEWLNKHTSPTERRYEDLECAREMLAFSIKQLLCNGTTMVLIFDTVHPQSVDALFGAVSHINMRAIIGKVMMDRNTPDYLLDIVESNYHQSEELIERQYKNGRLLYAITPRFTPTSSPEQMAMAQRLKEEYPDTWVHAHFCENRDEIAWVKLLYPDHDGYLNVYRQYGLIGKNRVFVHYVYLKEREWDRPNETKSNIVFCSTSNFYLGSGLSNLKKVWQKKTKVGMGTNIGAGITFNMLQTLDGAYKVLQLQGYHLSACEAFCLVTLGRAKSLGLDDLIGNFLLDKEVGFIVMEPTATLLQRLRYDNSVPLVDKLFVTMMLGDDRSAYHTHVDGRLVYERS